MPAMSDKQTKNVSIVTNDTLSAESKDMSYDHKTVSDNYAIAW